MALRAPGLAPRRNFCLLPILHRCRGIPDRYVIPKGPRMLSDTPAALPAEPVETTAEAAAPIARWGETALTVMFTVAAVLFVSFLAVVTGLI
jgi:hypothetical protein